MGHQRALWRALVKLLDKLGYLALAGVAILTCESGIVGLGDGESRFEFAERKKKKL